MKNHITISFVLLLTFSMTVFGQEKNSDVLDNETVETYVNNNIDNIDLKSEINKDKERDFTFGINAYLWAMTLNGSNALPLNVPGLPNQTPVVDVKLKFSDAIKYLKMAAMFAGKFKYKDVSLLYDVVYAKMQFDGVVPTESVYIDATSTLKQFIGDFDIAYRIPVKDKNIKLDGYGGIRISSLDVALDLFSASSPIFTTSKSKTWVDPVIGAAVEFNFSKRWFAFLKSDIGGFGISSDISWMVLGVGGYRITDNWLTTLGFKNLTTNYDKDRFLYNISQYGLVLSFGYQF
jgi:hypothetical protein